MHSVISISVNVPVPVFLLFDLDKLLSLPGVQFSETSQAGYGSKLCSGVEEFSKLNFDYIYDNSSLIIPQSKEETDMLMKDVPDNVNITGNYLEITFINDDSVKVVVVGEDNIVPGIERYLDESS